jgi:hypothetical protein
MLPRLTSKALVKTFMALHPSLIINNTKHTETLHACAIAEGCGQSNLQGQVQSGRQGGFVNVLIHHYFNQNSQN